MSGKQIEAVLKLNTVPFTESLETTKNAVNTFKRSMLNLGKNSQEVSSGIQTMQRSLSSLLPYLKQFNQLTNDVKSFNSFAKGLERMANAVSQLSNVTKTSQVGMIRIKEIMNAWSETVKGLTLNIRGYAQSTESASQKQNQFQQQLANLRNSARDTENTLMRMAQTLNSENSAIMRVTNATAQYSYGATNVSRSTEQLSASLQKNSLEMTKNAEAKLRAMGYTGQLATADERLANAERQVGVASSQASTGIAKTSASASSGTASVNRMSTATSGLGRALSSLRNMGMLVGSMIAYNFVHKLALATTETINAKSEMEGYFQMLHFSQGEIDNFNNALDRTVSQFQRINKYSLGETISSIGVEFNLTTQEMEKAMPVVSMITSEYLRAGRNVNEASLAVKDILQGEFQRLSRETGVKGKQLEDAGWSGDKNDVMGLLEALDKVGKSRNWDTFVTKANSLNDAVLILQNRFGEWSADMVNVVQPSIVNAFNIMMTVGGLFGSVFEGIWKWLNGDGLIETAVRWGAIATAITTVTSALISYRTGANLVQLVQMGLRGSIMATVLGLKAEEVATYGTKNAILSKITSIQAETVANMGVRNAIASKILGLNAEKVAQFGLKGAIIESVFAKEYETAVQQGANASELEAIALHYKEMTAKMSNSQAILTRIFSLNAETVAQKGTIVALAERISMSPLYRGSLKAEEVAELSTAKAGLLLMTTLLPLVGVVIGLAVAIYSLVKPLQDASEEMKSFNNLVQNGESLIESANKSVENLTDKQAKLNEELSKVEEGTDEYKRLNQQVKELGDNLDHAKTNLEITREAVEKATSSKNKFFDTKDEIAIQRQNKLADAYVKAGLSIEEAMEISNTAMNEANRGAEQLRKALQMMKFESDKGAKSFEGFVDYMKKNSKVFDEEKIKKFGTAFSEANEKIVEGTEKLMTSEDWMERIGGWFEIQQGRLEQWWTEFNAFWENRDWDAMGKMIQDGLWSAIKTIGADSLLVHLAESIGEKGVVGTIMEALFGEGDSDGAIDYINDWFVNCVELPMIHWLQWFISDPFAHFKQVTGDFWNAIAKFLFGEDAPPMEEIINGWFNDNIITPIGEWVQWFISDPVAHLGQIQMDFNNAISQLLFGTSDSETVKEQARIWVENNILKPLGDAILDGLKNIPIIGAFVSLFSLISDGNTGASQKGNMIGQWIGNALTLALNNIPIVSTLLKLLGLIPTVNATANTNGKQVGDNVDKGYFSGTSGMVDQAVAEFSRIAEGISKKAGELYASAQEVGSQILKGIKDALGMHSPSIISRELIPMEFGEYIPQAISDSEDTVYGVAQSYARAMYDGMNSLDSDFNLSGIVSDYQSDAQVVADYSQIMGLETTTAFNDMSLAVNNTTSQMQGNVVSSYSTMQTKQSQMLTQMKTSNTTAYNEMYTKSNQSLIQMRDSTSNVTAQMIHAWDVMKNSIIASARQISSDATTHFDQLSNTIGSFYRKIQNPSLWGAGSPSISRGTVNPRAGRTLASMTGFAGGTGVGSYNGTSKMSVSSLKLKICPNGDCGNIFEGYDSGDIIDVEEFLMSIMGEHGFGGWDFSQSHFSYIKDRTNEWDMKSPVINLVGGIPTNTNFKVREFANGNTPHIGFSKFQDIAGAIFSRIPYRLYFDSSWKGSWLGALQAGACNCYDGASALLALAKTFGFDGYMAHGDWSGIGHVWAVINGVPMDTTAWQGGYGWTSPKVHGYGSPNIHKVNDGSTGVNLNGDLNITINTNGNDVEVDNISEESARQILEILGVSLATGR